MNDHLNMPTVPLEAVVRCLTGGAVTSVAEYLPALEKMDAVRERERRMSHMLPAPVVRRLDAGLARSNPVHPDTALSLYAVCRAQKAKNIFETGAYWGYATTYLAAAARDNGDGKVWTFDIYDRADVHMPADLTRWIDFHRGRPSVESLPEALAKVAPEVFFQDSLHDYDGVA